MIGGRFGCEGTLLNRAKLDKFFINLKNRKSFVILSRKIKGLERLGRKEMKEKSEIMLPWDT